MKILLRFIAVVKSLCGIPEDRNMDNEIKALPGNSEENIKLAELLQNSLSELKWLMSEPVNNIMEELKKDEIDVHPEEQ
jgi:hypothetical protein